MSLRVCDNGHQFEKTSDCPICPFCSGKQMQQKFGQEFPMIGAPAFRAIDNIGIKHLSDLTKHTESELLALHGFGPRALKLLKEALSQKGLSFAKN